jgi:hypothetical protein
VVTRWSAAALLGGVAAVTACWAPAAVASPPSGSAELFVIPDPRITEATGLALSARHEGVLWMHNDSGEARLFGVGFDGATVAVANLEGATNIDWEAMARGPGETLWVGDIGDNDLVREEIVVYGMNEPELGETQVTPTRYVLRYPDGPRNAEALLVNPVTGRLWVATAQIGVGGLYEAPEQLSEEGVNELVRIRDVPSVVTDGTWSADGQEYVLRDYGRAWIFDPNGAAVAQVELPGQDQGQNQGESITYSSSGTSLLSGTKQPDSTIWEIPLSGAGPVTAAETSVTGGESGGSGEETTGGAPVGTGSEPGAAGNEGGIITEPTGDAETDDGGGPSGLAMAVAAAIATAFLIGRARRRRARV